MQESLNQILTFSNEDSRFHKFLCLQQALGLATPINQVLKKVRFWSFEIQTQITPELSLFEKLELLNSFFFEKKGFEAISTHQPLDTKFLFFDNVLSSKKGHQLSISLVYITLAEMLGIHLELIHLQPHQILKIIVDSKAMYVDLSLNGKVLTDKDILEKLNQTTFENSLDAASFNELIMAQLVLFEPLLKSLNKSQTLVTLYDMMLTLHSSHLTAIGKRAKLYFEMGCRSEAIADLKRYFLLCDPEKRPADLTEMYSSLLME